MTLLAHALILATDPLLALKTSSLEQEEDQDDDHEEKSSGDDDRHQINLLVVVDAALLAFPPLQVIEIWCIEEQKYLQSLPRRLSNSLTVYSIVGLMLSVKGNGF